MHAKGCLYSLFVYEVKSLKSVFGHRCFCLKIILAMLEMTLTMKIIFNETSKLLKKWFKIQTPGGL